MVPCCYRCDTTRKIVTRRIRWFGAQTALLRGVLRDQPRCLQVVSLSNSKSITENPLSHSRISSCRHRCRWTDEASCCVHMLCSCTTVRYAHGRCALVPQCVTSETHGRCERERKLRSNFHEVFISAGYLCSRYEYPLRRPCVASRYSLVEFDDRNSCPRLSLRRPLIPRPSSFYRESNN